MKALRIILAILLAGSSIAGLSQNQQGYVKTLGRPNQKGQALGGVSVRAKGAHNAVLSKNDGSFTMVMTGKKDGDSYTLQQVQKTGYELNDAGMIGRQYAFSTKVPITIVMVSQQQLQEDKLRIENKAYEKAEKNYKDKLTALEQQKKDNLLTEENFRVQIQDLQDKYSIYESLIGSLANHYAHTDYDELNEKEREINLCIEKGELEMADSLLQQLGVQKRIDSISQRLSTGQSLMNKAKSDLTAVLKQQQKDGEYLYQLYSIALSRFDNEKARFYIETRAELDTTNIDWQLEAGDFFEKNDPVFDKALCYYVRASEQAKSQYGEKSDQLATCYVSIGGIHEELGDFLKAIYYYEKALDLRKDMFEDDDIRIAVCYNNIGSTHLKQGHYDLAESLFNKALAINLANVDSIHINVASIYDNLGCLNGEKGNYKKAIDYLLKANAIFKKIQGNTTFKVASNLNNLGVLYTSMQDYQNALYYSNKALELSEKAYGKYHPLVAAGYNNVGKIYFCNKDYENAKKYFESSLEVKEIIYGNNHPNVAITKNSIAYLYLLQGDYSKALETYMEALATNLSFYGEENSNVAMNYNNIAQVFYLDEKYKEALNYYEKALHIWQVVYQENHPDIGTCYNNLAHVYYKVENYSMALKMWENALNIQKDNLGEDHPDVKTIIGNIEYLKKQMEIKE